MNLIEKKLFKINPVYLAEFEEFIKYNSQFGGGASDSKFTEGRAFSNVYEFYMYSYFIGLYNNKKVNIIEEDEVKTFWEMENWKPKELVQYLIACAIGSSDFDMINIEHMDEADVLNQVKIIKKHIESFANGGFRYIKELFDNDPELIQDDTFFIKLITESN